MGLRSPLPGDVGFKQEGKVEAMDPHPEGYVPWTPCLETEGIKGKPQPTEAPGGRGRLLRSREPGVRPDWQRKHLERQEGGREEE